MKLYKKFKVRHGHGFQTVDIPTEIAEDWIASNTDKYTDYVKFFMLNLDVFLRTMEADRQRRKNC